jgi:hypothetical protein
MLSRVLCAMRATSRRTFATVNSSHRPCTITQSNNPIRGSPSSLNEYPSARCIEDNGYSMHVSDRLRLIVLDGSGTTIDAGAQAPTSAFQEAFKAFDVFVSRDEAQGPMGCAKHEHIKRILEMPAVSQRWQRRHGRAPSQTDADQVYAAFIPLTLRALEQHGGAVPISGCVETLMAIKETHPDIKLGLSTGFTREMMDVILQHAPSLASVLDGVCGCVCSVGGGMHVYTHNTHVHTQYIYTQRP